MAAVPMGAAEPFGLLPLPDGGFFAALLPGKAAHTRPKQALATLAHVSALVSSAQKASSALWSASSATRTTCFAAHAVCSATRPAVFVSNHRLDSPLVIHLGDSKEFQAPPSVKPPKFPCLGLAATTDFAAVAPSTALTVQIRTSSAEQPSSSRPADPLSQVCSALQLLAIVAEATPPREEFAKPLPMLWKKLPSGNTWAMYQSVLFPIGHFPGIISVLKSMPSTIVFQHAHKNLPLREAVNLRRRHHRWVPVCSKVRLEQFSDFEQVYVRAFFKLENILLKIGNRLSKRPKFKFQVAVILMQFSKAFCDMKRHFWNDTVSQQARNKFHAQFDCVKTIYCDLKAQFGLQKKTT